MSDPESKRMTPRAEAIFRAVYDLNLVYGRGQLKEIQCFLDGRGKAVAKLQYGESRFGFWTADKPGNKITVVAWGHQRTVQGPGPTIRDLAKKHGFKPVSDAEFRNNVNWICSLGK